MRKKIVLILMATVFIVAITAFSACSLPEAPKKYTGVEITAMPSKTEYIEGENFDPSGMVVSAVYSDGSKEVIDGTKYNYDLKDPLKVTDTYVVILYMDKMTDVKINVRRDSAESVELKTPATRTAYYVGEIFDPTGMVITAECISGKTKDVEYSSGDELFTFDETPLTLGTEYVEVTYDGMTVRQNIVVSVEPEPYAEFGAYLADCASEEKTPVFTHETVLSFSKNAYTSNGVEYTEVKGSATDGEYIYAAVSYGEKKAATRIFKLDPATGASLGYSAEYTASATSDITLYVKDGYVYTRTKSGDSVVTERVAITSLVTEGEGGAFEAAADVPVFAASDGTALEASAITDIDFNADKRKYAVLAGKAVHIYLEDGAYESSVTVPGSGKINSDDLWNSHISTTEGYIYISYHNLYLNKHIYPVVKVYDWSGNKIAELTIEQTVIKSGNYTKQTDVLVMGGDCYAFFSDPVSTQGGTQLYVGISKTYTTEKQSV